jgi:hypothetical protein
MGNRIKLICRNGLIYFCKYCILTVPLGVIKSNQIEITSSSSSSSPPSLSIQKILDCPNLDSGLMNIVWLMFPNKFWKLEITPSSSSSSSPFDHCINYLGIADLLLETTEFTTFLIHPINANIEYGVLMCQVNIL